MKKDDRRIKELETSVEFTVEVYLQFPKEMLFCRSHLFMRAGSFFTPFGDDTALSAAAVLCSVKSCQNQGITNGNTSESLSVLVDSV